MNRRVAAVIMCLAACGWRSVAGADDAEWVTLFNGTSLDGWHVSAKTAHSRKSNNTSGGRWVVEDGAIVGGQTPAITTWINGVKISEWTETEPRHPARGRIALQVHGGGSAANYDGKFVRYRGIRVKEL